MQFWPKLFGAAAIACILSATLLSISPEPSRLAVDEPSLPEPSPLDESSPRRKSLMRREKPRPKAPVAPRPAEWGKLMRREGSVAAAAVGDAVDSPYSIAGSLRVVCLLLFGAIALIGFAMQAKGALSDLFGSAEIRKYFGLKDAK
eukprot:CAMPEP_0169132278 /NCGR_PEP_ID=MMETSP1015-20121227/38702_1 /TAXON_ID=342587 /ORGANISM="Karlodinium micrum, Strain CCMP2283" /LENGTH=145 /DNA_ID=CAMNT_0009196609 /DNA_START=128 /DNA_END=565 /DNA_ORIENTATION=+